VLEINMRYRALTLFLAGLAPIAWQSAAQAPHRRRSRLGHRVSPDVPLQKSQGIFTASGMAFGSVFF